MFQKLTEAELEMMEYFWKDKRVISCRDILDEGGAEKWSSGYLHNTVRAMLGKEVIHVVDQEFTGRVWARKFEASVTREEYAAKLALSLGIEKDSVIYVILAMAQQSGNREFEEQIKRLMEKMK